MTAPDRIRITSYGVDDVSGAATGQKLAIHAGTEYIRADLAAVPAQVRVKPLVWENVQTVYGPETYQAYGATGFYQVFTDEDSSAGAVLAEFATNEGQFGTIHARSVARVGGFIEAQAAAQADYEARILAVLEPQPDPRDAVIARLVEALRNIAEGNLGDAAWQANYARIKDVARAALAAAKAVQK
jgi:hypothetical protein